MNVRSPTLAVVLACGAIAACGSPPAERSAETSAAAGQAPAAAPGPASEPQQVPVGPNPQTLATKLPAEAIRASLPDLPMMASPRPREYVAAAYEFAGVHPEVLKYVPCFCGCERTGHQHNESCFVASRDAEGRVLSWDTHGMG